VTTREDLDALERLAERSLEGRSMSVFSVRDAGIDDEALRNLELEGLVEIGDRHGEPTVALTDAGLSVLAPKNSA